MQVQFEQPNPMAVIALIVIAVFIIWVIWKISQSREGARPRSKEYPYHLDRPVQYFQPGRIVLHIEHPTGLSPQDLAATVASSDVLQKLGQGKLAPPDAGSIRTFGFPNDRGLVFSLVPTGLNDLDPKVLVSLLGDMYNQAGGKPFLINSNADVYLGAASPNWLMSAAHHQIGTGGPGAWPEAADSPASDTDWKFYFPDNQPLEQQCETNGGAGVYVAILDTAPDATTLERAYHEHAQQHRLIERLLGPGGRLTVHPALNPSSNGLADYSLIGHRYWMPDHGLFVAGIINSVAPKAVLHLYEVLGPYGAGYLETITDGLLNALQDAQNAQMPLVINCSFVMNVPLDDNQNAPDFPFTVWDSATQQYMTKTLRDIVAGFTSQNIIMVAAAGNDAGLAGSTPANPPQARYPAAFPEVLGIGALPIEGPNGQFPKRNGQYEKAWYSNFSDDPAGSGYVTLGGDTGPRKGILGIYLSDLPDSYDPNSPRDVIYKSNTTGWAWWSGTSFATPIISAIMAVWCNSQGLVRQTPTAAQGFLRANADATKSVNNEDVIYAVQGPPPSPTP